MDSWSKFVAAIEKEAERLAKAEVLDVMFRGQGDRGWKLQPSLGRGDYLYVAEDIENNLFFDFRALSGRLMPPTSSSWDYIFAMQHYGMPTRLLDWTQSFPVAVYFALKNFRRTAAVWILDPYRLNRKTIKIEGLRNPEEMDHDYQEYFIDRHYRAPSVVALGPRQYDARVAAQRGAFTLHGSLRSPLEKQHPDCVKRFDLPRDAVDQAKRFVKLAGIHEYSAFPDLDGLGRHLRALHCARDESDDYFAMLSAPRG